MKPALFSSGWTDRAIDHIPVRTPAILAIGRYCFLGLVIILLRAPAAGYAANWSWLPGGTAVQTPHPAVVRVVTQDADGNSLGSGTLVDVRDQFGLVVTNWHVIRDAVGAVEVIFADGFRSSARVVKVDRDWDLAALLIWRPHVAPVRIAARPPMPGDVLSIAGYGPGSYRTVSGRCTQYMAPSDHHPFEIVELSVAARQGDSGGPILNASGELAGVLFGSDGGTTSGSYAGRVRLFLADAWPGGAASPDTGNGARAAADLVTTARGATRPNPEPRPALVPQPQPQRSSRVARLEPLPAGLTIEGTGPPTPVDNKSRSAAQPTARKTPSAWEVLAGRSLAEQLKTVLAGIGCVTVLVQLTRWFSPTTA